MLRYRRGGWISWSDADTPVMSDIVGSDAKNKKTRYLPTVLKQADRRGAILSPKLMEKLDKEIEIRDRLKKIIKQKDLPVESFSGYNPETLARLFGHQRVALSFMDYMPAYLLRDQPGVGKTPVAILWTERRLAEVDQDFAPRVLVITPNSAKYQWAEEIERWSQGTLWTSIPPNVSIIEGTVAEQNEIAAERDGWVVGHWESLVHARSGILENEWNVVILDEGHMIRNRDIKTTDTAHLLGKTTDRRLLLTAHPYVKAPDELYSLLAFLYPERYTSYWRFFSIHIEAKPKFFGGFDIIGTRSPSLLRWELAPFTIGRKKKDVFKSTPVSRISRQIDLPRKYKNDYESLRKEFFATLTGREKRLPILNVLSRTTRLRQFLVDPVLIGSTLPSLKYPLILELMDEIDGPPVIFTSFRQAGEQLQKFLKKKRLSSGMVAGKVNGRKQTPKDRRDVQKAFHKGNLDAVIVVTQAGGTALNFGRYGYVIYLDLPWTAKDLEQTEGRVDRPDAETGEIRHTTSYHVVIRNTYEERIIKKIEKTYTGFNQVFDPKELQSLF